MRQRSTIIDWNTNLKEAPELENLLVTIDGYNEVCIGSKLKDEWFLINDFEEEYEGKYASVKVVAWAYRPEIYYQL